MIKEVSVQLTEADLKTTRQTRRRKKGGAEPSVSPVESVTTSATATTPVTTVSTPTMTTTMQATATAAVITVPGTTATVSSAPATATTTTSVPESTQPTQPVQSVQPVQPAQPAQPTTGGVRFQTRKRHGLPGTPVLSLKAKILPIKRHAPPKEKPKLLIPTSSTSASSVVPVVPTIPTPKKRRFTERRIGISVKSLKSTRKASKSIRKQVAAMQIAEIRKTLLEKGVIKAKSKLPDEMLRKLMQDYLSLKA